MIDALRGRIVAVKTDSLTIDVNGIFFLLNMAYSGDFLENQDATLFVHMYWNQEAGPQLFGFSAMQDRMLFGLLLTVSGVGPRLALAVLRDLARDVVVDAILRGDSATLSSVSGLGRKKAETLILSLKDKVQTHLEAGSLGVLGKQTQTISEAIRALEALGYAKLETKNAVDAVCKSTRDAQKELQTHEILKAALKKLSKRSA